MAVSNIDEVENLARMEKGELYYAFTSDMCARRKKCKIASRKFNLAEDVSRRELVKMWRNITGDETPLPPLAATEDEDERLFDEEPYVEAPVKADYGYNVILGKGAYINSNCTFIDTCPITIGARTLVGPNCSFFSGGHPLDPFLRDGIEGPEFGKPIVIGEDCWLGGNVVVIPGVTIGRGVTVGAGSVVTKDVKDFCVVVGNPARVVKEIVPAAQDPKEKRKLRSLGTT